MATDAIGRTRNLTDFARKEFCQDKHMTKIKVTGCLLKINLVEYIYVNLIIFNYKKQIVFFFIF